MTYFLNIGTKKEPKFKELTGGANPFDAMFLACAAANANIPGISSSTCDVGKPGYRKDPKQLHSEALVDSGNPGLWCGDLNGDLQNDCDLHNK